MLLIMAIGACTSSTDVDQMALDRYHTANQYFIGGQYETAIPLYEFAIYYRDRIKDAYQRLSYCYEMAGRQGEARVTLEHLLQVDRTDEYALRNLMRLYTHGGMLYEAIDIGKKLAELGLKDQATVLAEVGRLEAVRASRATK